MKKVRTMEEAYRVFELLGIKDVTKPWQKRKGTEVWELPLKSMYQNGHLSINRFSIYRSGYVRKMVVYGKNNASMSCYQLNRTRKSDEYFKDYEWNDDYTKQKWTGKYRKSNRIERIMINTHQERVVYLCNYILKNYYRKKDVSLVGEYTRSRVEIIHREWWKKDSDYIKSNQLPFTSEGKRYDDELCVNDIKVIINGHRYNLS